MFSALVVAMLMTVPPAEPAPFMTFSKWNGRAMETWLTVHADGRWFAGNLSGQLEDVEFANLEIIRVKGNFEPDPKLKPCPGGARKEVIETDDGRRIAFSGRTCGPWKRSTAPVLVQRAEAFTVHKAPPLIRLERHPMTSETAQVVTVHPDGWWTSHANSGRLSSDAFADLMAAFEAATLEAPPAPTPSRKVCHGDYPHTLDVAGRGKLNWNWPCFRPSPTLEPALVKLYAAVGIRRP